MTERQFTFELDGIEISVPDPLIISEQAFKDHCARERKTGIVAVYDSNTWAGGFIKPGPDAFWLIYRPVVPAEFAALLNVAVRVLNPRTVN